MCRSNLDLLLTDLNKIHSNYIDFLCYLANGWCKNNLSFADKIQTEKVLNKTIDQIYSYSTKHIHKYKLLKEKYFINWQDIKFHLEYRIVNESQLNIVIPNAKKYNKKYELSIMPFALVARNKALLNKFIPKADFFQEHIAKSNDPYNIFDSKSRKYKDDIYVGSQKYERTLLMNITSNCPIGCVGCYKGIYTRTKTKFFTDFSKLNIQAKKAVNYLNNNKIISCLIISGGEPLLLSNAKIQGLFKIFKKSKYLKEIRICTGSLFQGLPFRIDDELLQILKIFESNTGIKICFNCHLSHPSQFLPEVLFTIRKIINAGFMINSQVPLQRNVNIFTNNFNKTVNTINKLNELQGILGIRPYKYILHMNVGSLKYSVPLEFILNIIGETKYRLDHPFPETWQPTSYSILYSKGNILLSPQLILLIKKEIFDEYIQYKIPVYKSQNKFEYISYIEPRIK